MYARKVITLLLILLATTAWGQSSNVNIDPAFNPENLLVDVRTPAEYAQGHIENAVNIPIEKITEEIKYFAPNKEKTIVVYCLSGSRSKVAALRLKNLGYKNIIDAGKYKTLKTLEEKLK